MKLMVALAWLVLGGVLTAGALLNGLLMLLEMYDPVKHDGLRPEEYNSYMVRLIGIPLIYFATFRMAFNAVNNLRSE